MIGPNGAGKSTLFKLLTSQEEPDKELCGWVKQIKLGYVDQSRDDLNDGKTVWEVISDSDELELGSTMPSRAYVVCLTLKAATSKSVSASCLAVNVTVYIWHEC